MLTVKRCVDVGASVWVKVKGSKSKTHTEHIRDESGGALRKQVLDQIGEHFSYVHHLYNEFCFVFE